LADDMAITPVHRTEIWSSNCEVHKASLNPDGAKSMQSCVTLEVGKTRWAHCRLCHAFCSSTESTTCWQAVTNSDEQSCCAVLTAHLPSPLWTVSQLAKNGRCNLEW